jgi:hypothetical protein
MEREKDKSEIGEIPPPLHVHPFSINSGFNGDKGKPWQDFYFGSKSVF